MDELVIKDIVFHGDVIRAAKQDDLIWVGVSWICQGLGFTKNQKDRQVKNIQTDKLLSRGCVKFDAGVFDANNETLALLLDYLPAWLFKIKVTPKMERDKPELVEKLISYQLKAKDILADAFISKSVYNEKSTLLSIQEYEKKIESLQSTMEKMYKDMTSLANIILDWKEQQHTPIALVQESWHQKINQQIDKICKTNHDFGERGDVLKYLYRYMNRRYGIVWEQEIKEYKDKYNLTKRPSRLEVIERNTMLKSIFESVLTDMAFKYTAMDDSTEHNSIDQIIAPLIKKYNDCSHAAMVTWRRVYRKMEEGRTIGWNNLTTRYMNEFGKKPTKRDLIETRPSLYKKFQVAVNALLNECND